MGKYMKAGIKLLKKLVHGWWYRKPGDCIKERRQREMNGEIYSNGDM